MSSCLVYQVPGTRYISIDRLSCQRQIRLFRRMSPASWCTKASFMSGNPYIIYLFWAAGAGLSMSPCVSSYIHTRIYICHVPCAAAARTIEWNICCSGSERLYFKCKKKKEKRSSIIWSDTSQKPGNFRPCPRFFAAYAFFPWRCLSMGESGVFRHLSSEGVYRF